MLPGRAVAAARRRPLRGCHPRAPRPDSQHLPPDRWPNERPAAPTGPATRPLPAERRPAPGGTPLPAADLGRLPSGQQVDEHEDRQVEDDEKPQVQPVGLPGERGAAPRRRRRLAGLRLPLLPPPRRRRRLHLHLGVAPRRAGSHRAGAGRSSGRAANERGAHVPPPRPALTGGARAGCRRCRLWPVACGPWPAAPLAGGRARAAAPASAAAAGAGRRCPSCRRTPLR